MAVLSWEAPVSSHSIDCCLIKAPLTSEWHQEQGVSERVSHVTGADLELPRTICLSSGIKLVQIYFLYFPNVKSLLWFVLDQK